MSMAPSGARNRHSDHHRTQRRSLQTHYQRLYVELEQILIRLDPLGVHTSEQAELAPEAASILARLREACLADDVERILLEEFHRWYGRRRLTLDNDRLADATIAICTLWNRFLADTEF
jgi:hypothetical protein